jgi:hypothetical protein
MSFFVSLFMKISVMFLVMQMAEYELGCFIQWWLLYVCHVHRMIYNKIKYVLYLSPWERRGTDDHCIFLASCSSVITYNTFLTKEPNLMKLNAIVLLVDKFM